MAVRPRRLPRQIIRTEEEAWEFLERLAVPNAQIEPFLPVIRQWPKMEFTFSLDSRGIALTAPIMQAMLDYQASINRAFLLVTEGSPNLRSLSEEDRQEFEALFKVYKGSTKLDVDLQELCEKLGKEAMSKLSGTQITIIVIAFALLYAGGSYWRAWLETHKEISVAESSNETTKRILDAQKFATEADLKKYELMNKTLTAALGNRDMIKASDEGREGVLKAAARVKGTKVAGTSIPPEVARPMARNARTPAEEVVVTQFYDVVRVDTDVPDGFRVRLRDTRTGEEFFANVREALSSANDRALIQRGEWSKKPIEARLIVHRRRGSVAKAMIAEVIRVEGDDGAQVAQND